MDHGEREDGGEGLRKGKGLRGEEEGKIVILDITHDNKLNKLILPLKVSPNHKKILKKFIKRKKMKLL